MSAYFRMSDAILDCDCARSLAECGKGDCAAATRLLIFIKILNAALNPSKCFVDAQSIADYFGAPIKQAQRIFDTCIQHNVLSWAGYGYNARKWLIDNGFIGKYWKEKDENINTGKQENGYKGPKTHECAARSDHTVIWTPPPEPQEGTREHDEWDQMMSRHSIVLGYDNVYGKCKAQ